LQILWGQEIEKGAGKKGAGLFKPEVDQKIEIEVKME